MTTQHEAAKICSACGDPKPLDDFRLRYANGDKRHSQCRECYNGYMRKRKDKLRKRALDVFATKIRDPYMDPKRVTQLVCAMTRRFGGVERFAEMWWSHMEGMTPGTPTYGRHLQAVLHLIEVNDLLHPPKPDPDPNLDFLSEEDIERSFEELLMGALERNPRVAEALSSLSE